MSEELDKCNNLSNNLQRGRESVLPIESLSDNNSETPISVTAPNGAPANVSFEHIENVIFIQDDETDVERIDNIEECSPTCSSTPIKENEDKVSSLTDDNHTVDMNLTNVGNTYDYNMSNQIILNQETTEKVMKILDESMQAYDEDGQLESLKDIGRIQVSFVFEGNFFFFFNMLK